LVIDMEARALKYLYGKDKLPRDWSYPLKRSVLDAALRAAGVTGLFSVRYSYGGAKQLSRPLHVQFDGDEPRPFGPGAVSITVYAVPSGERSSVMAQLESSLAAVCNWIRRTETAPPAWRMTRRAVAVEMRHGQARIVESR
jgi:hypothetical protein